MTLTLDSTKKCVRCNEPTALREFDSSPVGLITEPQMCPKCVVKAGSFRKAVCIDFDGVIHSYVSGWEGAGVVSDPPMPGAFSWLESLHEAEDIEPLIYSSRSCYPEGVAAMKAWFKKHGLPKKVLAGLGFPTEKPAAYLTVDDRGWRFQGFFPSLSQIRLFQPWKVEL